MHIDAAYAGSAFICPEFRPLLNGVEVRVSSHSFGRACGGKPQVLIHLEVHHVAKRRNPLLLACPPARPDQIGWEISARNTNEGKARRILIAPSCFLSSLKNAVMLMSRRMHARVSNRPNNRRQRRWSISLPF